MALMLTHGFGQPDSRLGRAPEAELHIALSRDEVDEACQSKEGTSSSITRPPCVYFIHEGRRHPRDHVRADRVQEGRFPDPPQGHVFIASSYRQGPQYYWMYESFAGDPQKSESPFYRPVHHAQPRATTSSRAPSTRDNEAGALRDRSRRPLDDVHATRASDPSARRRGLAGRLICPIASRWKTCVRSSPTAPVATRKDRDHDASDPGQKPARRLFGGRSRSCRSPRSGRRSTCCLPHERTTQDRPAPLALDRSAGAAARSGDGWSASSRRSGACSCS